MSIPIFSANSMQESNKVNFPKCHKSPFLNTVSQCWDTGRFGPHFMVWTVRSTMCWLSMENNNMSITWPPPAVIMLKGFIYCMLWWKGHFVQRSVMTDRPDYGSSSVCNEEMPRAILLAVWRQCECWWPVRQLCFMTYFFHSAPWDQRWSIPLHSQRGCSHHAIMRGQRSSQAKCCLVQGRMSHSQSKSTFLHDFFGCIP